MPRKHERLPILTEIVLSSASGNREARISDLSVGGCFVDTIVVARVGEEVSLKMTLPPDYIVETTGTIAYIFDGTGFGVSFTDLSETAAKSIEQFLASNAQ
jgi:Tfp pilus assembly protein PilZ